MIKIIWWIIVILYIDITITRIVFEWFAKRDFFNEAYHGKFPIQTFWSSIFWMVTIPMLLLGLLLEEIECEITARYYVYSHQKQKRRGEKNE